MPQNQNLLEMKHENPPSGAYIERGGEEVEVGPDDQEKDHPIGSQEIQEGQKEGKGPHAGQVLRLNRLQPQLCGMGLAERSVAEGKEQEGTGQTRWLSPPRLKTRLY